MMIALLSFTNLVSFYIPFLNFIIHYSEIHAPTYERHRVSIIRYKMAAGRGLQGECSFVSSSG